MSARKEGSLAGGIFWSLATFVAAKSVTFLSTLVIARIVAPEDFGLLASVLAYVALLELASDLAMKATVFYENEEGITPRVETAFTINLILAVLLAGLGVRELSMAAPLIPSVKEALRGVCIDDARAVARRALDVDDAGAASALVAPLLAAFEAPDG